ncbi:hypothetical protein TREMEDRAFT_38116 [Tremella mesenterica DSM 1558]|uniref:uncharacterized protein n=1 Tax=Tremella mesenterica (strain ATCC 24925 / CBS 8224 / DSM 1558 / NBRC 9311 / NRRL Y-6157 / RJB 2259-6 / UBC 559-6) TaxID=578456 RepID=UPI0003F4A49E|nr:uncharacterized protein TREMEDRAFT_38116 [Tremella mesenterica DSM 1558]EIW70365.1 hypothetical protein TREMEDRAFT_38116 [Tremella mesenterica DSM 1558]
MSLCTRSRPFSPRICFPLHRSPQLLGQVRFKKAKSYPGPPPPIIPLTGPESPLPPAEPAHLNDISSDEPTSSTTAAKLAEDKYTAAHLQKMLPTMSDLGLVRNDKVTVAMSGGVDSSLALRILADMPLDLNVVYMRNWDPLLSETPSFEEDEPLGPGSVLPDKNKKGRQKKKPQSKGKGAEVETCSWKRDWKDVQAVAQYVGIPKHRVFLLDLSKPYWNRVFEPAIKEWSAGGTPNPDVACNSEIKFGELLDCLPGGQGGIQFIATGHYARVKKVQHATRLCRGKDVEKDQSYYLSGVTEAQLKNMILPLQNLTKPWVRRLARFYGLPTADREESMGICFVGERQRFGDWLSQYIPKPETKGHLVTPEGKRIAEHEGLWYYTIGQRARVGGMDEQYFVARKGVGESGQDILVVPGSDHPALQCVSVKTDSFNWIAGKIPKGFVPGGRKKAQIQVRHRMSPVVGVVGINWNGRGIIVDFPEPIKGGVAPGQTIALWYQKWCLGSGTIRSTTSLDQLSPEEASAYIERLERRTKKPVMEHVDSLTDSGESEDIQLDSSVVESGEKGESESQSLHLESGGESQTMEETTSDENDIEENKMRAAG